MRSFHGGHLSAAHLRAPRQEKELATRFNGKTTKGSGCSFEKGDVRVRGIARIEAKTTTKKSFSVTRNLIEKIEDAAMTSGELPAMVVEFLDQYGKPEQEIAVVPVYVLELLIDRQSAD